MKPDMNPHLFVYGTLQQAFSNPFAQRLHATAVCLGAAQIPGRLYLLGNRDFRYPGVMHDPTASTLVHGELWRMDDAAATLAVLDHYEGTTSEFTEPHEYVRREIMVQSASGLVLAWCYVMNSPQPNAALIEGGKFSG